MAAPNPTCPSFKKWRGISVRNNQRVIQDAMPPVFAPKYNVYVPAELQDLLQPRPREYDPEDLKGAVAAVKGSEKNLWLPAVKALRRALSKDSGSPIQEVIDLGAIPRLVHLMSMGVSPQLQLEAAWALCNIASGTSAQCSAVVEAGALPPAITMLSSPDEGLREQAAWLLGNIAGDGAVLRDACLSAGLLAPLLSALASETAVKPLRQATWLLLNVTRFKPRRRSVLLEVLPTVTRLAGGAADPEAQGDALSALAHVADECGPEVVARAARVVSRAAELLANPSTPSVLAVPAAKVLSSLCYGDEAATQLVVDTGVLSRGYLRLLSESGDEAALREVCFALANIAAGSQDQAMAVRDAGLLPPLVQAVRRCTDNPAVQREATWALSNLANKGLPALAAAVREAGAAVHLAEYILTAGCAAEPGDRGVGATVVAAAEGLLSLARASALSTDDDEPNPTVLSYEADGVYDMIKSALDQGLCRKEVVAHLQDLLQKFPPPLSSPVSPPSPPTPSE